MTERGSVNVRENKSERKGNREREGREHEILTTRY